MLHDLYSYLLSIFVASVGAGYVSPQVFDNWTIAKNWDVKNGNLAITLTSTTAPKLCDKRSGFIAFSPVYIASQRIFADGKLIAHHNGDKHRYDSFYGYSHASCDQIQSAKTLRWEVTPASPYFARILKEPRFVKSKNFTDFISGYISVLGIGALFANTLFTLIIFRVFANTALLYSQVSANIALSMYLVFAHAGYCGINTDLVTGMRIADLFLVTGWVLFLNNLVLYGFGSRRLHNLVFATGVTTFTFVFFGENTDQMQFGTSLSFLPGAIFCGDLIVRSASQLKTGTQILAFLCVLVFGLTSLNDMMVVTGVYMAPMLFSSGLVAASVLFSLAYYGEINATFIERDDLLETLQDKVDAQAKIIKEKVVQLAQSERLASLGTLSAGIAHEINNSLNYVNGAIVPLKKTIAKSENELVIKKSDSLIDLMKEGLNSTFGIIKSLQNHTGLNRAQESKANIQSIYQDAIKMCKARLSKKVQIHVEIPTNIDLWCNPVAIGQILVNLVVNANDAVVSANIQSPKISVKSWQTADAVYLSISDNGKGVPKDSLSSIFDAFYTTKDVGKGSGMGLHIVKNEVEKMSGTITVENRNGAVFTVSIPHEAEVAAA